MFLKIWYYRFLQTAERKKDGSFVDITDRYVFADILESPDHVLTLKAAKTHFEVKRDKMLREMGLKKSEIDVVIEEIDDEDNPDFMRLQIVLKADPKMELAVCVIESITFDL